LDGFFKISFKFLVKITVEVRLQQNLNIMTEEKKSKKDEFEVGIMNKFNNEDFFDDCPVCQAMKLAQQNGKMLTQEELKEAFRKTKEKGAIVGGEK